MLRRLVQALLALAVVSAPALVVAAPPASAQPSYDVSVPTTFSPNGDGVQDTLRVRYTVPKPTRVRLEISEGRARPKVLRTVDLGWHPRGTYRWTWDGRTDGGRLVREGMYDVRLVLPSGNGVAGGRVKVDTSFEVTLQTPTYAAGSDARARVFPRTTATTDAVVLRASTVENKVESLRVVIRNAAGHVVRDADVNNTLVPGPDAPFDQGHTVSWAARRAGKPLPKGRYAATVIGRDGAGNLGRSEPVEIWVSADRLVWRETTTTVQASQLLVGPCDYASGPGCADYSDCGDVVQSALFVGGLSYRSEICDLPASYQSRASTSHLLQVPEATGVRGVSAVRVSFTGAPTNAGEPDVGTLRVWSSSVDATVTGTGGRSDWVADPWWGEGDDGDDLSDEPRRDPGAAWSFSTTGTDAFDVASFTVDVRYLVVAD